MKSFGIILIVIGLIMIFINQVDFTRKEKVVDLGSVEINKKETERIQWPIYAGAIVTIAGVVVLALGKKKAS